MIDFVAGERHFLDHTAPVWAAMPAAGRGRFIVDLTLADRAAQKGIDAEARDFAKLRHVPQKPARPGDGPVALVSSIGDIKIGRRLGYRRFVLMQHGAGQSYGGAGGSASRNPSYAGGEDNADVGLFLVPNEHSAERWRRAYPSASVVVVGCPRLDTLPRREPGPEPVIAIAFHWPTRVCPETLPALEFVAALPALAKRYSVIGHGHPNWPAYGDGLRRAYKRAGIEYVPDFDEVLRRADLLAFDNTSAGFEFAATGRPVVVMNAVGYRRNVEHGLRFWDAASVGVQVDGPDRLVAGVDRALENRPDDAEAREAALSVVYSDRRPDAALRAAAAVAEWLGARGEVAA